MTCFRPLSGSYISQCKRKTKGENHEQFPSPIGELHFSIDELIPIARDIQCFRPLSGSYISQFVIACMIRPFWHPVSVPYRGATFLNNTWVIMAMLGQRFPSPIGELHFSIQEASSHRLGFVAVSVPYRGATFLNINETIDNTEFVNSFRPLSGSYISQLSLDVAHATVCRVSVPYRGATFLNGMIFCRINKEMFESFRPLSGSYISQWRFLYEGKGMVVSVPYRGATFLNTIPATPCPVWDEQGDCGGKVISLKYSCFGK